MEVVTEKPTAKAVPEGYKRTEVGLIPEDWTVQEFGNITKPSNLRISANKTDKGIRCIELEHIQQGTGQVDGYSNLQNQKSTKTIFSKGDVLFGKLRPYLRKFYYAEFDGACSTEIWVFQNTNGVDNKLLYYIIQLDSFIEASNKSTGTHMPRADWEVVKEHKVALPPTLEEQQAIAESLSDVDALIAELDVLIEKKQQIKKGAMQQLLTGKKRLPGFEGEWEEKRIGELLKKFQNGNAFSAQGYVDNGIAIVTMAQIGLKGEFKFDEGKVNRWPSEDYDKLHKYHLKNGDLIISMTDVTPDKNLIGRMAIVNSNERMLLNQRVGLLVIDEEKINPLILKSLSNMEKWREYCKSVASLGVQANISTKAIKEAEITIPPIEEQNAIANVLKDMNAEIQTLQTKRSKYEQIKQGMMQELLTGKTRLV